MLFVSSFLLAMNGLFASWFYSRLVYTGAALTNQPRLAQAILFMLPALGLVMEWWLIDFVADRLAPVRVAGKK